MTVLNIVGNLNAIKSSLNFELAMRCVSDVISMLLEAESTIPLTGDYRRIPPIEIFFPWIMEACFATGEKIRGVIIAFQVLCQLFCCQTPQPHSTELLAHFYRAIQVGLKNDNSMVRDQIITEARHIFSYGLPGCTVLIPDLLTEIASLKTRATVPEVQKHAMTLFNSLICYVNHHKDINIPDIGKIHQLAQPGAVPMNNVEPVITTSELRETVATLMTSFLNNNMDPSAKGNILWGACVMLFEEITHETPRMNTTTQCLQALLYLARHPHDGVAVNASNVLTCLADFFDLFNAIDKNLPYSMINLISDSIALAFGNNGQPPPLRDSAIVALFEALTAWLSAGANDFLRDKAQAPRVFNAIELGLFGQVCEPTKLANSSNSGRLANDEDNLTAPIAFLLAQLRDRPSHNSAAIKSAAETALYTALELVNNFPTPAGATMISSQNSEIPEIPVAFFINNQEQLISVQILGHPNAETKPNLPPVEANLVRIIVRDTMGKHCWDMSLDYREHPTIPRSAMFDEPMTSMVKPPAPETIPKKTDLLATLLSKYDEKHLDCLPQAPKFTKFTLPPNPHESYAGEIERMKSSIVATIQNDDKLWSSFKESRPDVNDLSTNAPEPVSHMSLARIALSHLGFLSPMSRRNLHMVEDCDELRAAVAELDRLSSREQHSVSVRYLAPGQEEKFETTMEPEKKPSPLFEKFISGLGWKVTTSSHQGYMGHLTPESTSFATYHATATSEVLFEVLPHIEGEEVKKLSREQNLVEIVWSEHRRDYVPDFPTIVTSKAGPKNDPKSGTRMTSAKTLSPIGQASSPSVVTSSPGLDVSIGIYPLPNGQFRIALSKRDALANFVCGPLMHGMVVSSKLLPTLVRLTASFARKRASMLRQADWKNPRMVRVAALRAISTEFKAPKSGEQFHSCLYPLTAFPEVGVCNRKKESSASAGSSAHNSASFVPNMVNVDAAAKAAEMAAAATAAANAGDAHTSPTPSPGPLRLGHIKAQSRAYGVSRSAGSNRSLTDLIRNNSVSGGMSRDSTSMTDSLPGSLPASQPSTPAGGSPRNPTASPSPSHVNQNGISPRVQATIVQQPAQEIEDTNPPPPPPFEEVQFSAVNTGIMETNTTTMTTSPFDSSLSPFDDVVPPPADEPPPVLPSDAVTVSAQPSLEASAPADQVTIKAPSTANLTGPSATNSRAPSASALTASFKQPARPPAASNAGNLPPIDLPKPDDSTAKPASPVSQSPKNPTESPKKTAESPKKTAESPRKAEEIITPSPSHSDSSSSHVASAPAPTPIANANGAKTPPPAFGGPGKLPSGFKVPYGVGNFKVPAGVPKGVNNPGVSEPAP